LGKINVISRPVRKEIKKAEKKMHELLDGAPVKIRESVKDTLKAGGKRLRVILVLLSAMAGKYPREAAIDAAVAVELVHLASLIHDDILDEADTRRGRPTINYLHGYKLATAAGDYLFGLAFQVLSEHHDSRVIAPLSQASMELSLGEIMERDFSRRYDQSQDDYFTRINYKTASLFKSACLIGGIIGKVDEGQGQLLAEYGFSLGMAFQIYDDILDINGDEDVLGKPVGNDIREGIVTLPMLLARKDDSKNLLKSALANPDKGVIDEAIAFIIDCGAVRQAKMIARTYLDKALDSVGIMKNNKIKSEFLSIGEFVINRYN